MMTYDELLNLRSALKIQKGLFLLGIEKLNNVADQDLVTKEELHNLYMYFANHMKYFRDILDRADLCL